MASLARAKRFHPTVTDEVQMAMDEQHQENEEFLAYMAWEMTAYDPVYDYPWDDLTTDEPLEPLGDDYDPGLDYLLY